MSERVFALLVRFYPVGFRQAYGDEAVRLVLDRAREEPGILLRLRLLVDLLLDLAVTISHAGVWREAAATTLHPLDRTLSCRFLEDESPRPAALATGAVISFALLATLSASFSPASVVALLPAFVGRPQPAPHRPEPQWAQQAPAGNQTKARQERQPYTVASIKAVKPGDRRRPGMEFLPGGKFRLTNMPLFIVLATAYQIPFQSREVLEQRIKGIPDWMFAVPYDMEVVGAGEAPPGAPAKARNDRIRLMLQAVLADRLQLRIRRESTEMAVYALTVGSRGIKLERAQASERDCPEAAPFGSLDIAAPGCHQILGGSGRGLRGAAVDMADLAAYVSNWSDLPVVDRTGVGGLYQIQTEGWTSSPDSSGRTLDEVLDKLGLKLTRKKERLEVLVIEHAQRPSEN